MKICFEGPSGIGKTTLCELFQAAYKIIPEVNLLFKGETNEGGDWYYEKQVQRYQFSQASDQVIFDGDIFQPLWYNWTYNYPPGYYPLNKVYNFYLKEIRKGTIFFPDLYLIFLTSEDNLRQRKERDQTRRRSNFEKHLKLTQTQPKYFGFMKTRFPYLVEFIRYDDVGQAYTKVVTAVENRENSERYNSEKVLITIRNWLTETKPT